MIGDKLASGCSSAKFPPAGGNVSQEKWDLIFPPAINKSNEETKKKK
jgi:hypothetical protein